MTGMEQPSQVLFPTEIEGSVKLSVGIVHPFRTHTVNRNDPTIKPTIIHSNQSTGPVHIDQDYSPLGNFYSGTYILIGGSGRNIDSCTGVNPQGTIKTIILEPNISSN